MRVRGRENLGKKLVPEDLKGQEKCGQNETFRVADKCTEMGER